LVQKQHASAFPAFRRSLENGELALGIYERGFDITMARHLADVNDINSTIGMFCVVGTLKSGKFAGKEIDERKCNR